MPRIGRVVVPGYPHHVTQRGVRRMDVCFSGEDRTTYLDLVAEQGGRYGIQFLAWCLMTNHVHLIVVPLLFAMSCGIRFVLVCGTAVGLPMVKRTVVDGTHGERSSCAQSGPTRGNR